MKKLVHGVGINDADYIVQIKEESGISAEGKRTRRSVWRCPFYSRWSDMLTRAYSQKLHERNPRYKDCFVVEEWHRFSTFKAWMESQDWQCKELDKDLLFPGNKAYGPETCVFISHDLNTFLCESNLSRGEWPIGVRRRKDTGRFQAQINDFFSKKHLSIGCYDTPEEAHAAWLSAKIHMANRIADEEGDARIASALRARYLNYKA